MIEHVLKSKFLGALIGTGVGDSLGTPFEGGYDIKPDEIEATLNTMINNHHNSLTAYQ